MKSSEARLAPAPEFERESVLDDPRWQLAERIVASKGLAKSALLSKFLLYVCYRQIKGRMDEITEHQIGVKVFGRRAGYSPGDDNIVRNYARLLRKRLEQYFADEGAHEKLGLTISRGGYAPSFYLRQPEKHWNPLSTERSAHQNEPVSPPGSSLTQSPSPIVVPSALSLRNMRRFYFALVMSAVALVAILSYLVMQVSSAPPKTASHHLWSQLFDKDHDTFIVPADSALVILQKFTMRPVHLNDYVMGSYHSNLAPQLGINADALNDLAMRRYTSVADLNLVSSLARLPELVPGRFRVRYARDLRMDDLKQSNAILLGSSDSNPWVELFQKDLNFEPSYQPTVDASPVIINKRPLAGEAQTYANSRDDPAHPTYAVVAFLPNLGGTGRVLLIEGLTMAGTQAAGDFLLNDAEMQPIIREATLSNGSLKSFELLLETSNIGANAPRARLVAHRIYPN